MESFSIRYQIIVGKNDECNVFREFAIATKRKIKKKEENQFELEVQHVLHKKCKHRSHYYEYYVTINQLFFLSNS